MPSLLPALDRKGGSETNCSRLEGDPVAPPRRPWRLPCACQVSFRCQAPLRASVRVRGSKSRSQPRAPARGGGGDASFRGRRRGLAGERLRLCMHRLARGRLCYVASLAFARDMQTCCEPFAQFTDVNNCVLITVASSRLNFFSSTSLLSLHTSPPPSPVSP